MGTGAVASTFDLNGYSQSNAVTLATGAGGLTITNTSGTTGSINLANTGAASTIAFNVTGNTALVLSGAGSKNLTGANTYTGGTTVTAGTLDLTTLSAIGTGGLTLGSGTTFSLTQSTAATLGGALAGSGSFTVAGTGTVCIFVAGNVVRFR